MSVRVLLNSITMEIIKLSNASMNHKMVRRHVTNRPTWILLPRKIDIPHGFVYLLAPEDVEDGVEITSFSNDTFQYSRDGNDLVVSNLNSSVSSDVSTLIISGYYDYDKNAPEVPNNQFSDTDKVANVVINMGQMMVLVSTETPLASSENG